MSDYAAYFAEKRYEIIKNVLKECVTEKEKKLTLTDALDKVFLDKYLGIPIFLILMWGVFEFAFSASAPFSDLIDMFFSRLAELASENISGLLGSFIGDGIISGLGAVLVFVPPIFFLFFALSLLEDSGYIARAAFVMDKALNKVGLTGKSFVPMLLGFGCNIPAIMSTRTIENYEDRLLTILVNPLMSCSARLPVYVLIAGAFFPSNAGTVIFSMYLLGVVLAIILAKLFRIAFFKGKPSPFLLEFPQYHRPSLRNALTNMWNRGKWFLIKAGTIIFAIVVLVWMLSSFPTGELESSYLAGIGHAMQPLFKPLHFDWKICIALLTGFLAKEAVVGTLGVLYGLGEEAEEALQAILAQSFDPVTAYAIMAFTLIYIPCVATIGVIRSETASNKWTLFAVAYGIVLAYVIALIITLVGGALA